MFSNRILLCVLISLKIIGIKLNPTLGFQSSIATGVPCRLAFSTCEVKGNNFKTRQSNFVDISTTYISPFTSPVLKHGSVQLYTVANPSLFTSIIRSSIMTKLTTALTFFLSVFTIKQIRKHGIQSILWPNSGKDPSFTSETPLPPGSFGCPLIGNLNSFSGNTKEGPGAFWRSTFRKHGFAQVFKTYFMGKPSAMVSGHANVKNVLEQEFKPSGISALSIESEIMGADSVLNAQTQKDHSFLRNLVGMAMTNQNVDKGLPLLEQSAMTAINKMILKANHGENIKMEDICTEFTLDVAWRQILGLNLKEDEVEEFGIKVNQWIIGIINPLLMVVPPFLLKHTKSSKAKRYLDNLIENKIDQLNQNGPDGSTLSGMFFAEEDKDGNGSSKGRKLTKKQILDNALLLILAGSETSAGTLTTALMLLGIHTQVWDKVVEEQKVLVSKYGESLTKSQLDKDCPYLDAVIRETMRIRPINIGAPRVARDTLIVDGTQIPKGYMINFNVRLTHEMDPIAQQGMSETNGDKELVKFDHMDIYKGFKPERWLNEETKPKQDWMSFGFGPRYCLGANLAMAEMKTFLALLARKVDYHLVNDANDMKWQRFSIIPKPLDGTLVKIEERVA